MTDHRDEHEPYGFTESPVIARLQADIARLRAERDEARRDLCDLYVKGQPSSSNMTDKDYAAELGWDCFKNAPVIKTLKGVVVSKGKAVPPKFELGEADK